MLNVHPSYSLSNLCHIQYQNHHWVFCAFFGGLVGGGEYKNTELKLVYPFP